MATKFRSILELIERQVSGQPGSTAVRAAHERVSYAELNARANRLAHFLAAQGFTRGAVAAVLFAPGVDMVAALLAIQKLGGAYVPVDPDLPAQRQRQMIEDSGAAAVVCGFGGKAPAGFSGHEGPVLAQPWLVDVKADAPLIARQPDSNPGVAPDADDLLCILYTSGSTGTPKGVELTHHNVANCLEWLQAEYCLTADDVMLHKTPYSFDVSMYELFWPLMVGATVCIARPEGHRDPACLVDLIQQEQVTCAHFVPSMLAAVLEEAEVGECGSLRHVFAAGEALASPLALRFFAKLPRCALHNLYGPTEAGVVSHWTCRRDAASGALVPIGFPVANTTLHVLADDATPVKTGDEGDLWIGGAQLAAGYRQQPELTASRFVSLPGLGRLYRTGDRARQLPDGSLVFLGRRDNQVKIRGLRIELGEIEAQLNAHPGIVESAAGVYEPAAGDQRLIAWFRPRDSGPTVGELRSWLADRLPEPLRPQYLMRLLELPHLSNGKVDRSALPAPARQRQDQPDTPYAAPRSTPQQRLQAIWEEVLGHKGIGIDDRFFEAGGTSLLALTVIRRVRKELGVRLALTTFYSHPTIAALASVLGSDPDATGTGDLPDTRDEARPTGARHADPVAIVGLACRVPGADSVHEFWQLLADGKEGIRDLSEQELDAAGVPLEVRADPAYVRRAGIITDAAAFDAQFFGYTPREAALMDPQQRVLLECAWHALEDAGVVPAPGTVIGTYVGIAHNNYFDQNLATHDEIRRGDPAFQVLLGTDKDYAATRIAYKLNLRGPALTVQTACSTSAVAVHLASQAISAGECDVAIVGGARINVPLSAGYLHIDGGPMARDGRVRPFDAQASGMVLSSGVACLVLKRVSRAIADGDRIYALVRGTAINNDGDEKVGFTAPSGHGQARVINAALAAAGVDPASIGYVETHGTGTITGDPIEVAALRSAYADADRLALGSVKGNIGHLDAGAGAIGVVKAALALYRRELPPSIHCTELNPECELEGTPFFINTALAPWPSVGARRAGVSSFGFGGTNFHGIFEEGPAQQSSPPTRPWHLLRLSARSDDALRRQVHNLGEFLGRATDSNLADVAFTLETGRARLPKRAWVVARDAQDAARRLGDDAALNAASPAAAPPCLVFLFPGQGAQHVNMGRDLYEQEPVFRSVVDRCAAILENELGRDLRQLLYPSAGDAMAARHALRDTALAQPAIFTISYATACLWKSWGLAPKAMIGHSLGEFVAATLAGVFQLEHALQIITERGRLMQSLPTGGMLAVQLRETETSPYTINGVGLAAVNSRDLLVLSGPEAALSTVEQQLQSQSIGTTRLQTSHAFHSSMMDSVTAPFAEFISRFPLGEPLLPIISTVTGVLLTADEVRQPDYWARQLRGTVRFASAVEGLLAESPGVVFLEVGPGQSLTTSARRAIRPEHEATAIASLPHPGQEDASSAEHLFNAAGRLFAAGVELDPAKFHAGDARLKTSLPGYPFERVIHWIEPCDTAPEPGRLPTPVAAVPAEPGDVAAAQPDDPTGALLRQIIHDQTGVTLGKSDGTRTFLDLGFDSLLLTLITTRIRQLLKVDLQFRQLLEDFNTPDTLIAGLAARTGGAVPAAPPPTVPMPADMTVLPAATPVTGAFGASVRISRARQDQLTERQLAAVGQLIQRTNARTPGSKNSAQKHRAHLADPRTVSGFRPLWKELVYPVVSTRSLGPHIWDVDGNRYIDVINGFGATFFGHRPDFVNAAVQRQLERGYEVGPIQDFIGDAAELFTRLAGVDRVAFCNNGSEAVMAAMRCARTVTGRDLVAFFSGDYHGIQDEVLVRAGSDGRSYPATSGVPASHVANTLILPYGENSSLEILRNRAHELAAILVEPVQGQRLELQPRDFLHACRGIATEAGCAFIMDEVITGFRCAPGGAQEHFGVQADLVAYGKVFGGGLPVGAVGGIPKFMDALDGGSWRFGDDSAPEVGVTYFAGTFVRHPLVMAAVLATLTELEARPTVQADLNARVACFVQRLRSVLRSLRAPLRVASFSSLYRLEFTQEEPFGELLYAYLRERGLHTYNARLAVMTVTHSDEILDEMLNIYREAVAAMMRDGLLGRVGEPALMGRDVSHQTTAWYLPPGEGARLGTDERGNPQWYLPDPAQPGQFQQVGE